MLTDAGSSRLVRPAFAAGNSVEPWRRQDLAGRSAVPCRSITVEAAGACADGTVGGDAAAGNTGAAGGSARSRCAGSVAATGHLRRVHHGIRTKTLCSGSVWGWWARGRWLVCASRWRECAGCGGRFLDS